MSLSSFYLHEQAALTAADRYREVVARHEVNGWSALGHLEAEAVAIEVSGHWRDAAQAAAGTPKGNGASWSADRVRDLAERHAVDAELSELMSGEAVR